MSAPNQNGAEQVWKRVLEDLRPTMTRATFETYLAPSRAVSLDGSALTVSVPKPTHIAWLEGRLRPVIERAIGQDLTLSFIVRTDHAAPTDAPKAGEKITVEGTYIDRRNEIIKPRKITVTTEYFETRWGPVLGAVLFRVIVRLRRRAYKNIETGETRDEFTFELSKIAAEIGVDEETVRMALLKPCPLCQPDEQGEPVAHIDRQHKRSGQRSPKEIAADHAARPRTFCPACKQVHRLSDHFIVDMHGTYAVSPRTGKKIRTGTYVRVLMDDPLLPDDERKLQSART